MPNSGYQCLINSSFRGERKDEKLWTETSTGGNFSWERFLTNKYSRHMNAKTATTETGSDGRQFPLPSARTPPQDPPKMFMARVDRGGIKVNSIAPFATLGKPTCGYYFSRVIDHKKRQTGIPPSDLVKWRYFIK